MRSAPWRQTIRDVTNLATAQSFNIPGSDFLARGPRGGFARLLGVIFRLHLNVTTNGSGTLTIPQILQILDSITFNVSDGGGVHGPSRLRGDRLRAITSGLEVYDMPRRQIFGGETAIPISQAGVVRDAAVFVPFNLPGGARGDLARTVISLQNAGFSIDVGTSAQGVNANTTYNSVTCRIEAIYDEIDYLLATPHLRYERTVLSSLTGNAGLPSAMYRFLALHRESAAGTDTQFATADITRADFSVGGQKLLFNTHPEDLYGYSTPKVNGVTAETFSDPPGSANAIATVMPLFPAQALQRPAAINVSMLPLGTPDVTLTTTLTAANISALAATVYPMSDQDIIAQCAAQGASPAAVQEALSAGHYGIPMPGGKIAPVPKELKGFLPVRVLV